MCFVLLIQQLLYRHIFTLLAVLVEEYHEGNGTELELLLQIAPFGAGDVDVLALDVVGLQE